MSFPLTLDQFLAEFCLGLFAGLGLALGSFIVRRILG